MQSQKKSLWGASCLLPSCPLSRYCFRCVRGRQGRPRSPSRPGRAAAREPAIPRRWAGTWRWRSAMAIRSGWPIDRRRGGGRGARCGREYAADPDGAVRGERLCRAAAEEGGGRECRQRSGGDGPGPGRHGRGQGPAAAGGGGEGGRAHQAGEHGPDPGGPRDRCGKMSQGHPMSSASSTIQVRASRSRD